MKHPEGFTVKGDKELVCKLKKTMYGLKQSLRMWYHKFDMYIRELGFVRSQFNHCVYRRNVDDHFIYVVLYVDDMLLVGNNMDLIKEMKSLLSSKFNMKDLGVAHFILEMEIKRYRTCIRLWLNLSKYIYMILKRFSMQYNRLMKVPILVGVKLYVEQCTKTQ